MSIPALVDDILAKYDLNEDGELDFSEFMASFGDNQHRLKIKN